MRMLNPNQSHHLRNSEQRNFILTTKTITSFPLVKQSYMSWFAPSAIPVIMVGILHGYILSFEGFVGNVSEN